MMARRFCLVSLALLLVVGLVQGFLHPISSPIRTNPRQLAKVMPSTTFQPRFRESNTVVMVDLTPSVVSGIVAGAVGLSVGIGAMFWTENQTLKRQERKAAERSREEYLRAKAAAEEAKLKKAGEDASIAQQQQSKEDNDGW